MGRYCDVAVLSTVQCSHASHAPDRPACATRLAMHVLQHDLSMNIARLSRDSTHVWDLWSRLTSHSASPGPTILRGMCKPNGPVLKSCILQSVLNDKRPRCQQQHSSSSSIISAYSGPIKGSPGQLHQQSMASRFSILSRLQGSAFTTAAASCIAAHSNKLKLSSGITTALCTPQQQDARAFSSQNTKDQQFFQRVPLSSSQSEGAADSSGASSRGSDGLKHFATTSPEAVTSTGEEGLEVEGGQTVFTGTAEVKTDSPAPESDVATDANRHWMAADDLGTRATAATERSDNNTPPQQQGRSSEKSEDLCHPADPFCQAGEEAPMPDGFHEPEPGDDHIPPSSGFPA